MLLHSFKPKIDNFKNTEQYSMFKDWLSYRDFDNEAPAILGHNEIIMDYHNSEHTTRLVCELDDFKIKLLRERINWELNKYPDKLSKHIRYIENFCFKYNTGKFKYIEDNFLDTESKIGTPKVIIKEAFLSTDKNFISSGKIHTKKSEITFLLKLNNDNTIEIDLPNNENISIKYPQKKKDEQKVERPPKIKTITNKYEDLINQRQISEFEEILETKPSELREKYLPPEFLKESPKTITKEQITANRLKKYIIKNMGKNFSRELLNNRIGNPVSFLKKEFPQYQIKRDSNEIGLKKESFNK